MTATARRPARKLPAKSQLSANGSGQDIALDPVIVHGQLPVIDEMLQCRAAARGYEQPVMAAHWLTELD